MQEQVDYVAFAGCVALLWVAWTAWQVRRGRTDRRAALGLGAVLGLILAAGWVGAEWRGRLVRADMLESVLRQASGLAATVDPQRARTLSFTRQDVENPTFQQIRDQMTAFGRALDHRSIYSVAVRDGAIVFGPENLAPDDPAATRPGTIYHEAPPQVAEALRLARPAAYGPYEDEFGTFVSGIAPVVDPAGGQVVMATTLDIRVAHWKARIRTARRTAILVTLGMVVLVGGGVLLLQWRQGRPSRQQGWLRHAEPAMTAAVGLALTAIATAGAIDGQSRRHRQGFQQLADAKARILAEGFRDMREDLAGITRFCEASETITRQEFEDFSAPLPRTAVIREVHWLPRVPLTERAAFETRMQLSGTEGYRIRRPEQAPPAAPGELPDCYPVAFVCPQTAGAALGLDLACEPICRAAMEKSARSGMAVMTPPIRLASDPLGREAVLALSPVRRDGEVTGFVAAVLDLPGALTQVAASVTLGQQVIEMRLLDLDGQGTPPCLAGYPPALGRQTAVPDTASLGRDELANVQPLFVFDRTWTAVSRPGPEYLASQRSAAGMATAAGGTALTLAVAAMVGFLRNRQAFLACQVQQRTRELRERENDLSITLQSIGDAVIATDIQGRITRMNPVSERLTGWSSGEAVGKPIAEVLRIVSLRTGQPIACPIGRALRTGKVILLEADAALIGRDSSRRPIADSAAPIRDVDGQVRGAVMVFHDVTAEHEAKEALQIAARTDKLTGLPNRTLLNDRLEQAVKRARRMKDYRFAVLFLDFDRFKIINDSLGHEVGDALLKEIAGRLRRGVREVDTVSHRPCDTVAARLGGDEFVVLLDGIREPGDARRVADRLLESLSQPYRLMDHEVVSTASIGIVTSDVASGSAEEILRDADTAMYEAKNAGKARYVVFDTSMRQRVQERLAMENDLRKAIERNELFLAYQPIVSLTTGRVEGLEALLRWRHPQRGLVPTSQFIPVAEECALIVPIGEWAIREACRQMAAWRGSNRADAPASVSVNLARTQLMLPDLPAVVGQIVRQTGVEPSRLHLEITESAVVRDTKAAARVLDQFKKLGVQLALDDFGAGYSSLACLRELPLDVLKIDRSFVASVRGDENLESLIRAVIQLARSLEIAVVAEGIDLAEQLRLFQDLGCPLGQGFLFSEALDPEQALAFCRRPVDLPERGPRVEEQASAVRG